MQIGAAPALLGGTTDTDRMEVSFNESSLNSVNEEECGDGYTCGHDGGAYGCGKISAPPGSPMVCCSTGQSVKDCDSTSSPIHPLPFCPFGGATGEGCVRGTERKTKETL